MAIRRIPPGPSEKYDPSHDLLGWMQRCFHDYGDIYKASIYGSSVYVVNSPECADHVLRKRWQSYLRKGQAVKRIQLSLGNGLISSNGKFWASQRRMMQPAFNRAAIGRISELIEKANVSLLRMWKAAAQQQHTVNVTHDTSILTLEITLRAIFDDDYERIAPHFALVAEEARDLAFAGECQSLSRIIIETAVRRRRSACESGGLLGFLMQARDRDTGLPMSDIQLAREVLTLVIAGHETTASVLNWTWYLLARYPSVDARLYAELAPLRAPKFPLAASPKPEYLRATIEEALRLYPPLWLVTRKAMEDDQLGEYFVPAGTEIYLSPYLIQRHPSLWQDPEGFDPGRFAEQREEVKRELSMCPFGAGPRNCIGEHMARLELETHFMVMIPELELRYGCGTPAQIAAGTNLLSHGYFIMSPVSRLGTEDEALNGRDLKMAQPIAIATPLTH